MLQTGLLVRTLVDYSNRYHVTGMSLLVLCLLKQQETGAATCDGELPAVA